MLRGLASVGLGALLSSGAASLHAETARIVPLAANDLGYDATRATLWATVDPISTSFGSQVVPIDPTTGAISSGIAVGSEPSALDVADDGSYLYVGDRTAPEIRRVDLASRSVDLVFALAPEWLGAVVAEEIEVHPSDPHAIAISRMYLGVSPRHAGIALYDDGIQRGAETSTIGNRIEFSEDGGILLGLANEVSSFAVERFRIDAAGVTALGAVPYRVMGFSRDMHASDGLLLGTDGALIRQSDLRLAALLQSDLGANAVALDPATRSVYLASPRGVEVFDRDRFVLRHRMAIAGILGVPLDAVLLGPGHLAFRTTQRQVVIVDLEVGSADADGDGVLDAFDNCAGANNAHQEDLDGDATGDACDPDPADSRGGYAACATQRSAASASLAALVGDVAQCAAGGFPDADGDGEPDARDRCASTLANDPVDERGCSQAQFCAAFPVATCKRGDFRNDEAGIKRPGDCAVLQKACRRP